MLLLLMSHFTVINKSTADLSAKMSAIVVMVYLFIVGWTIYKEFQYELRQ